MPPCAATTACSVTAPPFSAASLSLYLYLPLIQIMLSLHKTCPLLHQDKTQPDLTGLRHWPARPSGCLWLSVVDHGAASSCAVRHLFLPYLLSKSVQLPPLISGKCTFPFNSLPPLLHLPVPGQPPPGLVALPAFSPVVPNPAPCAPLSAVVAPERE